MEQYKMTKNEIIQNFESVNEQLKDISIKIDNLKKDFSIITGENVTSKKLSDTEKFKIFYGKVLNCRSTKELEENIYNVMSYVFENKANGERLVDYITPTFGLVTPETGRKIKNPTLNKNDMVLLKEQDLKKKYIENVLEIFDCYREFIMYTSPAVTENQNIVALTSSNILKRIYLVINNDIKVRGYAKECCEEMTKIIDIYKDSMNKKINIKNEEKFVQALNENVDLDYDGEKILYGQLVKDFVKQHNNLIDAKKYSEKLIKMITRDGVDNSEKMLEQTSDNLSKKMDKNEDVTYFTLLNQLLDLKVEEAYNGDSINFYHALAALSLDCTHVLNEKGICPYKDDFDMEHIISTQTK